MKPANSETPQDLPPPERSGRRIRLFMIWGLMLVGIALLCIIRFRQPAEPPQAETPAEALREVPRSELTRQDGRLFLTGHTNPFTGIMLEFYGNESMKSRSMISNGVLHGISEGWHTNGQVAVQEYFKNGVSHGQRTKWYLGGAKLSEASIVEGELHGTFRYWHENGALGKELEMQQGKAEGVSRSYYPSGSLKAEVTLRDGKPTEQKFWKDGER